MDYDATGRLTEETWLNPDGSTADTLTYAYDPAGNLLTAANNHGDYTFTYTALDQVATQTDPFNLTLTFTYDQLGHRTSRTDSLGGNEGSGYDADGRLLYRSIGSWAQGAPTVNLTYAADGRLQSVERGVWRWANPNIFFYPAGSSAYAYDAAGRLTTLIHSGPDPNNGTGAPVLAAYGYSYDAANRLTQEDRDGVVTGYGYDATDQLLTQDGFTPHSYDANGNRTDPGYVTGAGNRLQSVGGFTYSYDAEDCLRIASALGASCVRAIGTTPGVFTKTECEMFLGEHTLQIERL